MSKDDTLQMTISSVMRREKEKIVHVRFERHDEDKIHFAEGILPDCIWERSYGFTEDEMVQLKFYLKEHMTDIFEQAQKINDNEIWLHS